MFLFNIEVGLEIFPFLLPQHGYFIELIRIQSRVGQKDLFYICKEGRNTQLLIFWMNISKGFSQNLKLVTR